MALKHFNARSSRIITTFCGSKVSADSGTWTIGALTNDDRSRCSASKCKQQAVHSRDSQGAIIQISMMPIKTSIFTGYAALNQPSTIEIYKTTSRAALKAQAARTISNQLAASLKKPRPWMHNRIIRLQKKSGITVNTSTFTWGRTHKMICVYIYINKYKYTSLFLPLSLFLYAYFPEGSKPRSNKKSIRTLDDLK